MPEGIREVVSTGNETLDRILGGGLPRNRSVLVTGGPGTGKSTLSMQFLQEGIREGDDCLFVSTEQTPSELRDTFAPYGYDLDHENLIVTSIHARPGYTLDDDQERLTIETLEGDQVVGKGYSAPFSGKYVSQMLGQYAPADRVVIDSVSGLRAMADDRDAFRRAVLDLIRLLSDEFEATALLVSERGYATEETGRPVNPLQYNAHGVIRLWLEEIRSDIHRFLQVMKMRGVGHDTRSYEIEFDDRGVFVIPRNRNAVATKGPETSLIKTHIAGLDELLGGGFIGGDSIAFKHDGHVNLRPLFTSLLKQQLETDTAVLLMVPKVGANPELLEQLFPESPNRITELFDSNELFVVDVTSKQESDRENVYTMSREGGVEHLLQLIDDRRGEKPLSTFIDTETAAGQLSAEQMVDLHRLQETHLLTDDGMTVYVHNPDTVPDGVEKFFTNNASQALEMWRHNNGLQYLTLEKSPIGYVGTSRLVDHIEESPFVRIQSPPGHSEIMAN